MTFTFTEEEVKRMLNWAGVAEHEDLLEPGDDELIKRMSLAVAKDFSDMTNFEKIMDFLLKTGIQISFRSEVDNSTCFLFKKNGKDTLTISENADYKTAIQHILDYENS